MSNERKNSEEKKTSEKPVSLSPLKFKEALANLLAVWPKKEDKGEKKKEEETSQKED